MTWKYWNLLKSKCLQEESCYNWSTFHFVLEFYHLQHFEWVNSVPRILYGNTKRKKKDFYLKNNIFSCSCWVNFGVWRMQLPKSFVEMSQQAQIRSTLSLQKFLNLRPLYFLCFCFWISKEEKIGEAFFVCKLKIFWSLWNVSSRSIG